MVARTIEDAMHMVGSFGRFQKILVLMAGLLVIPNTIPNMLMVFVAKESTWHCLPNATDCNKGNATLASNDPSRCTMQRASWEFTLPKKYSIITEFDLICEKQIWVPVATSIYFVGLAISSAIFGRLADKMGRKKILFATTVGTIVAETAIAASPNIYIIVGLRLIAGIFKGGTTTQALVLASEYVDNKHRASVSMFILLCTVIAQILFGVIAYFVQNWRLLVLLTSAPYLVLVLFYFFIPESIRWLVSQSRDEKAVVILKKIGRINGKKIHESEINFTTFCLSGKSESNEKKSACKLFQGSKHSRLTTIMGPSWLAAGLLFYALSLAADQLGGSMYENFILIMAVEIPGYIIVSICSRKLGNRLSVLVCSFMASLLCFLLIVSEQQDGEAKHAMNLVIAIAGKFFITGTTLVQFTWSSELYPTEIRSEALGFLVTAQTIGGACAPWVVEIMQVWHPLAPYIFLGSIGLIITLLQYFLPETNTRVATFSDVEIKMKDIEQQ